MRFERERLARDQQPRASGLGKPLIVSLTSYPPRFPSLHLTLTSLLNQSVAADEIILWIAREHMDLLPESARALGDRVRIAPCDDLSSYKKLIFTVQESPDRYIAIADDDVYYKHDWLEELVQGLSPSDKSSCCHVVFRFHLASSGDVAPFLDWEIEPQDPAVRSPATNTLPIGVGGVLYPPNAFHDDVVRSDLFQKLAPHSDDIWFYAMARLNGVLPVKVGGRFVQILWPGSQDTALWSSQAPQRSDDALRALVGRYGPEIFQP